MRTDYKQQIKPPLFASLQGWKTCLFLGTLAFFFFWHLRPLVDSPKERTEYFQKITAPLALPSLSDLSPSEALIREPVEEKKELGKRHVFHIRGGDNLCTCFRKAGLPPSALEEILTLPHAHYLKKIHPGQTLSLSVAPEGHLTALQWDRDPLTTYLIQREERGTLTEHLETKAIEKRLRFGGSIIQDSFFGAGKQAQLDDTLIMALAKIFAYDIDFTQDIKPKDHFKVLFEEHFVNDTKIGNGPILAATVINNGKKYTAIRYVDPQGKVSYYTPTGQSLKKAFIRTPVAYTRISSHFNLHRHHPVLHTLRAHRGVDYAAPHGTPVKAAGDGKVLFVGNKGGYGNTIILQHGTHYTTLYGHLSGFAKRLIRGNTVKQGEIIGYVGATGLASGPHLHFEFRVNGVHHDPLTVTLPKAGGLIGKTKTHFLAHAKEILQVMDRHEKVLLASTEAP